MSFRNSLNTFCYLAVLCWISTACRLHDAGTAFSAEDPSSANETSSPVHFGRDVLPILSENCFSCHGPDESHRKADLRLDTPEGAAASINLQQPDLSTLMLRVTSSDPELVMPPPDSKRMPLSDAQVDVLRRWIGTGAAWGRHWAFEPPVKADLPVPESHPVDAFIGERLRTLGLTFSHEASRITLARRISFDLTGLPPSPEDVTAFEQDAASDAEAVGNFADRLLKSAHYGERMAMWWLDAARYADTDGFQGDATRTNWPWRDWVVSAFNSNMPYDQFTIEQFAGDLLPNATPEQKLATCFHRNHMTNGEGGRDPEESRIDYVIDRVSSTGTVWLGMTLGCCQCHSHKFDPISQHEFYSLAAFFNSIDESGKAGRDAKPYLSWTSTSVERAASEAQQLVDSRKQHEQQAQNDAEVPFTQWLADQTAALRSSAEDAKVWQPMIPEELESTEGTQLIHDNTDHNDVGVIQASGPDPRQDDYRIIGKPAQHRVTGVRLEVLPHPSHTAASYSRGSGGYFVLTDIKFQVRRAGSSQVRDIPVSSALADLSDDPKKYEGYGNIQHVLDDDPRNGWSTRDGDPRTPRTALFAFTSPVTFSPDEVLIVELRQRSTRGNANIGRFRILLTDQAGPVVKNLDVPPLEQLAVQVRSAGADPVIPEPLRTRLREQFLADYAPFQQAKAELDQATRQLEEIQAAKTVDVMVLAERVEPRPTHVLLRGVWDKKGDVVTPGIPAALSSVNAQGENAATSNLASAAGSSALNAAPETIAADTTSGQLNPAVSDHVVKPDRLVLAKWLTARDNPLAARVLVNHLWQMLFGTGIVKTAEDFGLQSEAPSHPELLDWLAVDLIEHHWDVKRLLRLIITSRTYRQSSHVTESLRTRDPENRLLARGARFRLPAWMLRDAALKSSGLLNPAVGGPPVRPYQPEGVWEEMFMGRFRYEPSAGAAQYRRTLYAFWRRAIAPTFLFDSAQRRVCEVRTARTNTPLQALTLLNDATFLEASRAIAEQAIDSCESTEEQIHSICRSILSRPATVQETDILKREYMRAAQWYAEHPNDAVAFLNMANRNDRFTVLNAGTSDSSGDAARRSPNTEDRQATLAALVLTASTVLNLDEAITHE